MVYTPFFDKYILKREVYTDTKLAEILSDIGTRLGALESKEDTNTQPTPQITPSKLIVTEVNDLTETSGNPPVITISGDALVTMIKQIANDLAKIEQRITKLEGD